MAVPTTLTCDQLIDLGGKPCPRLFGDAPTPILMYLAARPGSRWKELVKFLGRRPSTVHITVQSLRKMGLICGRRRYWLNASVRRSDALEKLLRAMAADFGIAPKSALTTHRKRDLSLVSDRTDAKLLSQLFQTRLRTTVLLLVAALGEIYPRELVSLTGSSARDIGYTLHRLYDQGIVESRRCRQMRLYRLSAPHPCASELKALLIRLVIDRADIMELAQTALTLRRQRHFRSSFGLEPFFTVELRKFAPAKSVNGIQRRVVGAIGPNWKPPLRFTGLGGRTPSKSVRRLIRAWKQKRSLKRAL